METSIDKAQQFILSRNNCVADGFEPLNFGGEGLMLISFIEGEETFGFTDYTQILAHVHQQGMRILKVWYFQDFLSLSETWPVNSYGWDSGIYGVLLVRDDNPELNCKRELTADENAMLLCNDGSWATNLPKLI